MIDVMKEAKMQDIDLNTFYRWNSEDLMLNQTRGFFAEYLLDRALRINSRCRKGWEGYDVDYNGTKIEVKSAAYWQTWKQEKPSTIQYDIHQRVSDLFVLCLLHGRTPTDLTAWDFWVIPTTELPNQQKTIRHS